MNRLITILVALVGLSPSVHGKAYFQSMQEMIHHAESIAIISISHVKSANEQGKTWIYQQVGKVKTDSVLKGDLPKEFNIYGSEDFICAKCQLKEGVYLAFLKKDGELWTGSNWHLSLRPIQGESVEWYISEDNLYDMKPTSLKSVVEQINDEKS